MGHEQLTVGRRQGRSGLEAAGPAPPRGGQKVSDMLGGSAGRWGCSSLQRPWQPCATRQGCHAMCRAYCMQTRTAFPVLPQMPTSLSVHHLYAVGALRFCKLYTIYEDV